MNINQALDRLKSGDAGDRAIAEAIEAEIERLRARLSECDGKLGKRPCQHGRCMEYLGLVRLAANQEAEIERLKALWYADTDPEKTEYAEDFYLRAGGKSTREPSIEIERLREALVDLFEDGEPSHSYCGRASECFSSGRCGRGAYETPLENAAGGCWFSECGCMSDAQRNAAQLIDTLDRAALAEDYDQETISATLVAEDKDPITEHEALSLSRQLWDRISKLPDDEIVGPDAKANALRAMGWDPDDVLNHCFACEYTRDDINNAVCTRCPVTTWREEADYKDSHPCIYGSYGYFVNVKTPTERRAAAIAIRDLMKEEVK